MASGPEIPDFTKFFAEMKLPALPDMEAFLAANRKNIETFLRYAFQQGYTSRNLAVEDLFVDLSRA